jgi:hypothetical protein
LAEPTFRLLPIRATAFQNVLTRLGAAPNMGGFALDTIVTPVSLVDSDITLNASTSTPLVNVPFTANEVIAPAAATRLANTGALPAGPYSMVFWISSSESNSYRIRRRNAADNADIWSFRFNVTNNSWVTSLRLILALNELIVVENITLGGAGSFYQAAIFSSAG